MGYSEARKRLDEHRGDRIDSLLGASPGRWFTDLWGSVSEMLKSFSSDKENQEIAAGYATDPSTVRAAPHLRLDYVCALRREVRKQYVSGEGDLCTDVTPFRHGVMSAHGARLFDDLMDTVVSYSEKQAKGAVS